jgi:hypothetical protein
MEVVVEFNSGAWTKFREMILLSSNFESSWNFDHRIICVSTIDDGCKSEYKIGPNKISIIEHDAVPRLLSYLKDNTKNVVLTSWDEPSGDPNQSLDALVTPNSLFRAHFPYVPIIGDVHHKSNPHIYIENYITKYQPTALLGASCPHILAPICTRHRVPYSIYPWRINNDRNRIKVNSIRESTYFTADQRLKLLYTGAMLSSAHPRRTAAVKKIETENTICYSNIPPSVPDVWVKNVSMHEGAIFYCSLNSQFSHHLLLPATTGCLMFIDDGVKANRFIFPLIPKKNCLITYDFTQLDNDMYLHKLLKSHLGDDTNLNDEITDLDLEVSCTTETNRLINKSFKRRYFYYRTQAMAYESLRKLSYDFYLAILNMFDLLQEVHRRLLNKISLNITCATSIMKVINLWMEPFRLFTTSFNTNDVTESTQIVLTIKNCTLIMEYPSVPRIKLNEDLEQDFGRFAYETFLKSLPQAFEIVKFNQNILKSISLRTLQQ